MLAPAESAATTGAAAIATLKSDEAWALALGSVYEFLPTAVALTLEAGGVQLTLPATHTIPPAPPTQTLGLTPTDQPSPTFPPPTLTSTEAPPDSNPAASASATLAPDLPLDLTVDGGSGSGGVFQTITVQPGIPLEYSFYWKGAGNQGANWFEFLVIDGPFKNRLLWSLVDRPNHLVKIPATREGLPAIRSVTLSEKSTR